MNGEKKTKGVLVKTSNLTEEELDKALDSALDALFGPDDDDEPVKGIKPEDRKPSSKGVTPKKPGRKK